MINLDEHRFDRWLVDFDRAVTAALGGPRPPDDPPLAARLLVAA